MSQFFQIHPTHPQQRLITRAVDIVQKGGVIVYPTDASYAIGCQLGEKEAKRRIEQIRQFEGQHLFSLLCNDLSEVALYSRFDNQCFRLLKSHMPGPYTFILQASKEVPKRLLHPKRKTIGLRVPDHPITMALLRELGKPLLTSSLILPGEVDPECDPYEMRHQLERQVDLIIDGGYGILGQTSIVDLTEDVPKVIRHGLGEVDQFL